MVGTFHHIIAVKAGELEGFIGWILSDMKKNKNNVNACAQKLLMLSHDPAALSCDSLEDPWVKLKKKTKNKQKQDMKHCNIESLAGWMRSLSTNTWNPGSFTVFHPKIPDLILQMDLTAHHTV